MRLKTLEPVNLDPLVIGLAIIALVALGYIGYCFYAAAQ